jgi:hypothetical protein
MLFVLRRVYYNSASMWDVFMREDLSHLFGFFRFMTLLQVSRLVALSGMVTVNAGLAAMCKEVAVASLKLLCREPQKTSLRMVSFDAQT